MTIFYFIGIFEAFFIGALLLLKKNRVRSEVVLASYFIMFGLNILCVYLENYNIEQEFALFPFTFISPPFMLLHGQLLWLYSVSLTSIHFKFTWKHFIHFIPFFIFSPMIILKLNDLPVESKLEIISNETFKDWFFYKFYVIFITLLNFTYLIWGIKILLNFQIDISKKLKNITIDYSWLNFFYTIAIIIYGLTLPVNVLDIFFGFVSFKQYQYLAYLVASLLIPVIGFYGHTKSEIFNTHQSIEQETNLTIVGVQEDRRKIFIKKFLHFLKEKKPYLKPDLSLHELAQMLEVTPDYLSEIINNDLNKNFLDLINTFRVEDFKTKLRLEKNNERLLIDIAFESGFSSKATFNRVFKNKTNMTPSEYKMRVSK